MQTTAPRLLSLLVASVMVLHGLMGCSAGTHGMRMDVPIVGIAKAPAGVPAIDVSNATGTVTITIDPKAVQPSVRASTRDGRTPTWVAATMAGDKGRPVLRVLNADPRAEGTWVNIAIVAPSCGGLRVRNAGGPVTVDGVSGAIDVEVNRAGTGDSIWVRASRPSDAPILLRADAGNVVLLLPSGSSGELRARSLDGAARVDSPADRLSDVKSLLGDWTGRLNGGGESIDAMTGKGDVLIRVGR